MAILPSARASIECLQECNNYTLNNCKSVTAIITASSPQVTMSRKFNHRQLSPCAPKFSPPPRYPLRMSSETHFIAFSVLWLQKCLLFFCSDTNTRTAQSTTDLNIYYKFVWIIIANALALQLSSSPSNLRLWPLYIFYWKANIH